MEWQTVESSIRPTALDTTSSRVYNYVRKDIEEKTREDEMTQETVTYYEYKEQKILKADWAIYEGMTDNAADIAYIAMMADIEL